jgi:hypothetical protein
MIIDEYPLECAEVEQIAQKFNDLFKSSSCFTPRSLSLWRDLYSGQSAHLLLAKHESETFGYLIVGLHQYSGIKVAAIFEMCVWDKDGEAAKLLIKKAELLTIKMGAVALISWESSLKTVNKVLQASGFFEIGRSVFSVGVTSSDFFKQLLENPSFETNGESENAKILSVDLSKKSFPSYSGRFKVKIYRSGRVTVIDDLAVSPYAFISSDVVAFSELVLGQRNPLASFLSGRITIRPIWRVPSTLYMLRKLQRRLNCQLLFGDFF